MSIPLMHPACLAHSFPAQPPRTHPDGQRGSGIRHRARPWVTVGNCWRCGGYSLRDASRWLGMSRALISIVWGCRDIIFFPLSGIEHPRPYVSAAPGRGICSSVGTHLSIVSPRLLPLAHILTCWVSTYHVDRCYIIILMQARVLPTAVGASLVNPKRRKFLINDISYTISSSTCGDQTQS